MNKLDQLKAQGLKVGSTLECKSYMFENVVSSIVTVRITAIGEEVALGKLVKYIKMSGYGLNIVRREIDITKLMNQEEELYTLNDPNWQIVEA